MKTKVWIAIQEGHNRDTYIFEDADVTDFQKVLKPRIISILNPGKDSPEDLDETVESVRFFFDARGEMEHRRDVLRGKDSSD